MISPELARIVAHIAADGYTSTYNQRRSKKELLQHPRNKIIRKRWRVCYVNTEPTLARQFIQDVKKEFNRTAVPRPKYEYYVDGKRIYESVTRLGALKSHNWFIPEEILTAPALIKTKWLRAFFDDEAHVSRPDKRIVLNMVNKKGLKQVQQLLQEFNIPSTLNGPYNCRQFFSYHLCIYRKALPGYAK